MNRKLTIDKIKLIPKLIEEGKTYNEIAKTLDVSVPTIQYWITRLRYAQVKMDIKRGPKPLKLDD